jgi:putative ATPase
MSYIPLAYKLRPKKFDDVFGQESLTSPDSFFRKSIEADLVSSMILFGPPGCGKTSIAFVIANITKSEFVNINAVSSGVADLKKIIKRAQETKDGLLNKDTLLFIDEIHRFNKKQQDYLLPFVENGTIILIGATTENPSYEVNSALLSRCSVFSLKALENSDIEKLLENSVLKIKNISGYKDIKLSLTKKNIQNIADLSNGDARFSINILEKLLNELKNGNKISEELIKNVVQKKSLNYDKKGSNHYDIVSAFIKSMRGSNANASIYWLARMIEGGEDPKFIARRMIIFASEDIGLANPTALLLANETMQAVTFVGLPECKINLAECVTYLAKSKKDNSSYKAINSAILDVRKLGDLDVPLHLRNAHTKLDSEMGYGDGYIYPHDADDSKQQYMPDKLKGKRYF